MPSFKGAWEALSQFTAAVKSAVPDALLQIEETENRLGISLTLPPAAAAGTTAASSSASSSRRGRPAGSPLAEAALLGLIGRRPGITRDQILAEARKSQPGVNAGTLATRLSALVKAGRIRQEGEGYHAVEAARAA